MYQNRVHENGNVQSSSMKNTNKKQDNECLNFYTMHIVASTDTNMT